jgi:hypothetical protein
MMRRNETWLCNGLSRGSAAISGRGKISACQGASERLHPTAEQKSQIFQPIRVEATTRIELV